MNDVGERHLDVHAAGALLVERLLEALPRGGRGGGVGLLGRAVAVVGERFGATACEVEGATAPEVERSDALLVGVTELDRAVEGALRALGVAQLHRKEIGRA